MTRGGKRDNIPLLNQNEGPDPLSKVSQQNVQTYNKKNSKKKKKAKNYEQSTEN